MKKTIIILIVSFVYFSSKAPNPACAFMRDKDNFSVIRLLNNGILSGWLEIYNKSNMPVRLVNPEKRYSYTLDPYARRSFNFRGMREIKCFSPNNPNSTDPSSDFRINCEDYVAISKCYDVSDERRYPDLGLE